MTRYFSIILVTLLLTGCKKTKVAPPEKPDNLIARDKMVRILEDMLIVSSAKGVSKQVLESNGVSPDIYIYEKYGIDSIQFKHSNAFYAYDVEGYQEMFVQVQKNLEQRREHYQNSIDAQKKKRDSTIKARKVRDSIQKADALKRKDSAKDASSIQPDLIKKQ